MAIFLQLHRDAPALAWLGVAAVMVALHLASGARRLLATALAAAAVGLATVAGLRGWPLEIAAFLGLAAGALILDRRLEGRRSAATRRDGADAVRPNPAAVPEGAAALDPGRPGAAVSAGAIGPSADAAPSGSAISAAGRPERPADPVRRAG